MTAMDARFRKVRCVVCNYSRRQSDCERAPVNRVPMWVCKWCAGAMTSGVTDAAGVRQASEQRGRKR